MFRVKKAKYKLQIPQPCTQNWHQMTLAERGRFCASCQKVVRDFTGLSDAEIIEEIKKANGAEMCGRFLNTQLNRELKEEIKVFSIPKPDRLSKIAASLVLATSLLSEVSAQQKSSPAVQQSAVYRSNKPHLVADTGIVIKAKVLNYHNNQPLKKIEIEIEGTNLKAISDQYGRIKFQLPDTFVGKKVVLKTTDRVQHFLDSTSSIIQGREVYIDSANFNTEIKLYRYPMVNLDIKPSITGIRVETKNVVTMGELMAVPIVPVTQTSTDKKNKAHSKHKKKS